jgi:hypothetical protein
MRQGRVGSEQENAQIETTEVRARHRHLHRSTALQMREVFDEFIPAVNPQFPMNAHPMAVRSVDANA